MTDACDMCYAFGQISCGTCCNTAVSSVPCYCGWCISNPDFAEHVKTVHADSYEYHTALPESGWQYDENGHWKDCILCGEKEHRTQERMHSFGEDGRCHCGYQKPALLKGDLDLDGSVSISDVTTLLNVIAGKTTLQKGVDGDLDGDGSVSISDVTKLLNVIAGKEILI